MAQSLPQSLPDRAKFIAKVEKSNYRLYTRKKISLIVARLNELSNGTPRLHKDVKMAPIIQEIENDSSLDADGKEKKKKEASEEQFDDFWLWRTFSVDNVTTPDGVVSTLKKNGNFIVSIEELYDRLQEGHIETGHGGRDLMFKHLGKKYKNITFDLCLLFVSLCPTCLLKRRRNRKKLVTKPILSSAPGSRVQCDCIDMQGQPDELVPGQDPFKYILHYQDHHTKLCRLKALKTKSMEEVAHVILLIMLDLGAPGILQTDNGREFDNQLVTKLCEMWPGLVLVHGKPRHSQSQGSVERGNRDVEDMLRAEMAKRNTTHWAPLLPFVQYKKNTRFHSGIKQVPFTAMFGTTPPMYLKGLGLSNEVLNSLRSEEDLLQAAAQPPGDAPSSPSHQDAPPPLEDAPPPLENAPPPLEDAPPPLEDAPSSSSSNDAPSSSSSSNDAPSSSSSSSSTTHVCVSCQDGIFSFELEYCRTCETENHPICLTDGLCSHCHHKLQQQAIRVGCKRAMAEQAMRMLSTTVKKLKPCGVGDSVTIPISDLDRGRCEGRNLLAIILEENNGLYLLGCSDGILGHFTRNQFEPTAHKMMTAEMVPDVEAPPLRTLAIKNSIGHGQGMAGCRCSSKSKCDGRCKCRKAGKKCTSSCHPSYEGICSNRDQ